ncbi:MAG TPA: membrane protein insertase YidC, partial [Burkholderiaceae bacterium]|nr:membrane protein insertase YidC [Burkholderiaceae bacterium]
ATSKASASSSTGATVAAAPIVAGETPVTKEPITITTDVFKAVFSTEGGQLTHLELLKEKDTKSQWLWDVVMAKIRHTDTDAEPQNEVIFDDSPKLKYLAQTGLLGLTYPDHRSGYVARPGPRSLDNSDQVQLILDSEKGGVKLTKIFTFKRGQYSIDVKHEVTNNTGAAITPSLYLQLVRDGNKPETARFAPSTFTGPALYTDADKFQTLKFEKIETGKDEHSSKADNGWIALVQHFFVSAFIPPQGTQREIYTKKIDTNLYAIGTILPMGSVAPGATANMDTILFSGPQDTALLQSVAPHFDLVKDYGFFTVVAKPIFWVMDQIHKVLGNWGWTIIAFTVLMKIVFFPLSASSFKSMAKMKLLTPKMTAIRERHKADPQKMNQEMMELYKTEKVNPIGGCLPVLIQMPVFIALYSVLQASIETRNAPWIGWIQDLSTSDPLSILPVLMAIAMFLQSKLNPAPADPVQAKVMMYMPLVFSAMFFTFPSGVVLYYVVNTTLGIGQQWLITRKLSAPKSA